MTDQSQDRDPEKYIFGNGKYTNQMLVTMVNGDREFRLEPFPMRQVAIAVFATNILIAACFGGIAWIMHIVFRDGNHKDAPSFFALLIVVGVLTCIGYSALALSDAIRENRLGTLLIFDKQTGSVTLPRQGMQFSKEQVLHVQYITTKRPQDWIVNNSRLSELNLVTCVNGHRQRWPLSRAIAAMNAFEYIVNPILEHTTLSVIRIKDQLYGWRITETPMRRGKTGWHKDVV